MMESDTSGIVKTMFPHTTLSTAVNQKYTLNQNHDISLSYRQSRDSKLNLYPWEDPCDSGSDIYCTVYL